MATSRENSAHSVFSIELSQHGLPRAQSAASPREAAFPGAALFGQTHLLDRLRVLCTPTSAFERQLLEAAASAKPRCRGEDGFQLQLLQAELCALGYLVDLKVVAPDEALATRQGPVHILENLHHQYLLCTGTRDAPRMANCIIEPRCREQFQIAYPTPAYEAVLTEVPDIFVGTPRRLHALVDALAPCVAEAFAAQSTPLPPWRKKLSMLTKWNLKGLAHGTRAPAPVLQPQHAPAFAQSLQLLQEALDSGRLAPHPAAPDRLEQLHQQLARAQAGQMSHVQLPAAAAGSRQQLTGPHRPGPVSATLTQPPQLPSALKPPVQEPARVQVPPSQALQGLTQGQGPVQLAWQADDSSGHARQEPESSGRRRRAADSSSHRRRGGTVHVVPPLPEPPSTGVNTRAGVVPSLFPWLCLPGAPAGSPATDATSPQAAADPSRRSVAAETLHHNLEKVHQHSETPAQDPVTHDASRHDSSRHDSSKHEGSKHEGSQHVRHISAAAGSPMSNARVFTHSEDGPVGSSARREPRQRLNAAALDGPAPPPASARPVISLLAKALEKMVVRSGSSTGDRSGSGRNRSNRGSQRGSQHGGTSSIRQVLAGLPHVAVVQRLGTERADGAVR